MKLFANKKYFVLCIIMVAFSVLLYLCFAHGDLTLTSTHGYILLKCIFNGEFMNFYNICSSFGDMLGASYSIIVYLVFAIWSIPVYLVSEVFNIGLVPSIECWTLCPALICWYKLIPLGFFAGSGFVLIKIINKISNINLNSIEPGILLAYVFCPIFMLSTISTGHYDSIGLFFLLLAFYYYINDKMYLFTLFIALGTFFKLFALFVFVPLLLFKHKKLINIAKFTLLVIAPYLLSNLIFLNTEGYAGSKQLSSQIIERFFCTGIQSQYGLVPIFFILFFLVCLLAYLKKPKNNCSDYSTAILLALLALSCLFVSIVWHPQWVVYLVPFIILSIYQSKYKNQYLMIFFLLCCGYFFVSFVVFINSFDEWLITMGVLKDFFNMENIQNGIFANILLKIGPKELWVALFDSALIGCCIISFIDTNKIYKSAIRSSKDKTNKSENKDNKSFYALEINNKDIYFSYLLIYLSPILIFAVPAFAYFVKHAVF